MAASLPTLRIGHELRLLQGATEFIPALVGKEPGGPWLWAPHNEHRLPHEVTLLRANSFPPCAKCGNNVAYQLLRAVTVDRFSVVLNAIPELTDSQVMAASAGEDDSEKAG